MIESNIHSNQLINYGYDRADRLTSVTYPNNEKTTYQLDKVGNRKKEIITGTSPNTKTYTYNDRDQLTGISDTLGSSTSYTYDNAGNQLTKDTDGLLTTFDYSPRQRVKSITVGAQVPINYQYDYTGQRINYERNGSEKRYLYDGLTLIAETNTIGNTIARYHYGDRYQLAEQRNNINSYYHVDSLGTNVAVTNQDGSIQARYEYDAYGNLLTQAGSSETPFGFTGYQKDEDTGLYYANARYYDSETGRFLREDPFDGNMQTPPSLHRYLYAFANPTVFIDPTGNVAILKDFADWLHETGDAAREISNNLQKEGGVLNKIAAGGFAILSLPSRALEGAVGITNTTANIAATGVDNLFGGNNLSGIRQENLSFEKGVENTAKVINKKRFQIIPDTVNAIGSTIGRAAAGDPNAFFDTVQGGAGLFGAGWLSKMPRGAKLEILPQYRNSPVFIGESSSNKIQLETPTSRPIPILKQKKPALSGGKPDWLRRLDEGNDFNRSQSVKYDYNEVYINKPNLDSGYYRLDSYNRRKGEIVSRKHTQFSNIQEKTGLNYINELLKKHPIGATISDVPSSGNLAGFKLNGYPILEVPVQIQPVPKSILNAANNAGVLIRDIEGRIY